MRQMGLAVLAAALFPVAIPAGDAKAAPKPAAKPAVKPAVKPAAKPPEKPRPPEPPKVAAKDASDPNWGSGVGKQPSAGKSAKPGAVEFSDEKVAEAIRKGVDYLKSQQLEDGSWGKYEQGDKQYPVGLTAMAVYAMIESELVDYSHARMKKSLDWLKERQPARVSGPLVANPAAAAPICTKTYELGLRASAFLAAIRHGGVEYREALRKDAQQIILSTQAGSYGYDCLADGKSSGDHSNSQYGVLGVWAASLADEEVPRKYWQMVYQHWEGAQSPDGGWNYRAASKDSTATMTTAGLATMYVCFDNLLVDQFVTCNLATASAAVFKPTNKALVWLEEYFGKVGNKQRGIGDDYYLYYGVERVGLATGYKFFGKHDWYKAGAADLLGRQNPDGSWTTGGGHGNAVVHTAYALLFLVRGRHAVLFNKLEYPGDWNNRPRDMASLTRWMSMDEFETTVNWQIVNLNVPPEEWRDAPILYIAGATVPKFTQQHLAALRRFAYQGGVLFSCAECVGKPFSDAMKAAYAQIFPDYKLTEVPADHPLYSINFPKLDSYVKFQMLDNGVRPLAIHVDGKDLPKAWQIQQTKTEAYAYGAAANLALYVTDKALKSKTLAARGARDWPRETKFQPLRCVAIARLKYRGNWNPEPLMLERLSRLLGNHTRTQVAVTDELAITDLSVDKADVAFLTGTASFTLSGREREAIKKYTAAGGLVVIDAAGGSKAFAESARVLLTELDLKPRRLTASAPVWQQKGFEIGDVRYRSHSRQKLGITERTSRVKAVMGAGDDPRVFVSEEDLTTGTLGADGFGINGYQPESAWQLVRNMVLSKAKAPAGATQPSPPAEPARTDKKK
jgi:hypothetical protein